VKFWRVTFSGLEEFEGFLDQLYGLVGESCKPHPAAPRRYYKLGEDCWGSKEAALSARKESR